MKNLKPIDEIKNKNNIIHRIFWRDNEMAYEKGDDIISDWLLDNGSKPCESVLIKM